MRRSWVEPLKNAINTKEFMTIRQFAGRYSRDQGKVIKQMEDKKKAEKAENCWRGQASTFVNL